MDILVKIEVNESLEPMVSGRELHKALGVATAYKDWFPRMTEYGFIEGQDFNPLIFEQVQTEGSAFPTAQIRLSLSTASISGTKPLISASLVFKTSSLSFCISSCLTFE